VVAGDGVGVPGRQALEFNRRAVGGEVLGEQIDQ
jgi:hypothetical protein